ncbi:MAG: type II CAAX prenyl endopeptidase Rce1 family protein [Candidatus Hodarchaeota archaeon]
MFSIVKYSRKNSDNWLFFLFTFIWTWTFWIPLVFLQENVLSFPYIIPLAIGGLGPTVAAIILTYLKEDQTTREEFWKRIYDYKRISLHWWVVIVLFVPVCALLGMLTHLMLGGDLPSFESSLNLLFNPLGLIFYSFFILLYGPAPEELGWRGVGLDLLQNKWDALTASLVLGGVWCLWHLPMFYMVGTYQAEKFPIGTMPFFVNFCLSLFVFSIVMTWVFNNTKKSVLSAIMFHFMFNFTGAFLNLPEQIEYYRTFWTIIITLVIIIFYGSKRLTRNN